MKERCADLLLSGGNFDRAVREATLILENRLRKKFALNDTMSGFNMVERLMPDDPTKAMLKFSDTPSEHVGYKNILKGIFQAHRNKTSHGIYSIDQVDAARICAYIDLLLNLIERILSEKSENLSDAKAPVE